MHTYPDTIAYYKKQKIWHAKFTKTKPSASFFVVAIQYVHIHDLRHAKHVMQACCEHAFTFSIKMLWRDTHMAVWSTE